MWKSCFLPSDILRDEPGDVDVTPKQRQKGQDGGRGLPRQNDGEDSWSSVQSVSAESVELLCSCVVDVFSDKACSIPLALAPFQNDAADPIGAKNLVNRYMVEKQSWARDKIVSELKCLRPLDITLVLRWIWHRVEGGIFTREAYAAFKKSEAECEVPREAIRPLLKTLAQSSSHYSILEGFLSALVSYTAWARHHDHSVRSLVRHCAWFVFPAWSFRDGSAQTIYDKWNQCASALEHLYLAYLQCTKYVLPQSLQGFLSSSPYPPVQYSSDYQQCLHMSLVVNQEARDANDMIQDAQKALTTDPENTFKLRLHRIVLTHQSQSLMDRISAVENKREDVFVKEETQNSIEADWAYFARCGFEDLDMGEIEPVSTSEKPKGSVRSRIWAEFMRDGFISEPETENDNNTEIVKSLELTDPKHTIPTTSLKINRGKTDTSPPKAASQVVLSDYKKLSVDPPIYYAFLDSQSPESTLAKKEVFAGCMMAELRPDIEQHLIRWLCIDETRQDPDIPKQAKKPIRLNPFRRKRPNRLLNKPRDFDGPDDEYWARVQANFRKCKQFLKSRKKQTDEASVDHAAASSSSEGYVTSGDSSLIEQASEGQASTSLRSGKINSIMQLFQEGPLADSSPQKTDSTTHVPLIMAKSPSRSSIQTQETSSELKKPIEPLRYPVRKESISDLRNSAMPRKSSRRKLPRTPSPPPLPNKVESTSKENVPKGSRLPLSPPITPEKNKTPIGQRFISHLRKISGSSSSARDTEGTSVLQTGPTGEQTSQQQIVHVPSSAGHDAKEDVAAQTRPLQEQDSNQQDHSQDPHDAGNVGIIEPLASAADKGRSIFLEDTFNVQRKPISEM